MHAAQALHEHFVAATDFAVMHSSEPHIRASFGFPDKLWPLIRRSFWRHKKVTSKDCVLCCWSSWGSHVAPPLPLSAVAGRLDFALTPTGLKVYEYNADSASCLLQCGEIQVCALAGCMMMMRGGPPILHDRRVGCIRRGCRHYRGPRCWG